jgi:integrase
MPSGTRSGLGRPASKAGYLSLDNWRTREWYDALDGAGIARRGPYHLRHTFASEALAAGISIFELSRLMGTSVKEIDRTYGHLVRDSGGRSGPAWTLADEPPRRTRDTDAARGHASASSGRSLP